MWCWPAPPSRRTHRRVPAAPSDTDDVLFFAAFAVSLIHGNKNAGAGFVQALQFIPALVERAVDYFCKGVVAKLLFIFGTTLFVVIKGLKRKECRSGVEVRKKTRCFACVVWGALMTARPGVCARVQCGIFRGLELSAGDNRRNRYTRAATCRSRDSTRAHIHIGHGLACRWRRLAPPSSGRIFDRQSGLYSLCRLGYNLVSTRFQLRQLPPRALVTQRRGFCFFAWPITRPSLGWRIPPSRRACAPSTISKHRRASSGRYVRSSV